MDSWKAALDHLDPDGYIRRLLKQIEDRQQIPFRRMPDPLGAQSPLLNGVDQAWVAHIRLSDWSDTSPGGFRSSRDNHLLGGFGGLGGGRTDIFTSSRLGIAAPDAKSNDVSIRSVTPAYGMTVRVETSDDGRETDQVAGDLAPISIASLITPDQSLIIPDRKTVEGILVRSTSMLWAEVAKVLLSDFKSAHEIGPRLWEEMVAGCFDRQGYDEVILTPRSGDHGRDVIAIKHGIGSVRILGSVKAYKPGHHVTRSDVSDLAGVLLGDTNASKGIMVTTSDFVPRLLDSPHIASLVPYRMQLINGEALRAWILDLL